MTVAPFGSWPSPITPADVAGAGVGVAQLAVDGDRLYWLESRPSEGGRVALMAWDERSARAVDLLAFPADHPASAAPLTHEATGPTWSIRSRVHEYGGGALAAGGGSVFFVGQADQRIWRLDPGSKPVALTPESDPCGSVCHGDLDVSPKADLVAAVRQRPLADGTLVDEIIVVPTGGGPPTVVAAGRDLYSSPRLGPDGQVAWLAWDLPHMPWQAAELWLDGRKVAGGVNAADSQPRWLPTGQLAWLSDAGGWVELHVGPPASSAPPEDAALGDAAPFGIGCGAADSEAPLVAGVTGRDLAGPDWSLGNRTWGVLADARMVAAGAGGRPAVAGLVPGGESWVLWDPPGQGWVVSTLVPWKNGLAMVAASATTPSGLMILPGDQLRRTDSPPQALLAGRPPTGAGPAERPPTGARSAGRSPEGLAAGPRALRFATAGDEQWAHGWFHPPAGLDGQTGPEGELPPVVINCHSGPTGAADPSYDPAVAFWTTRGFAYFDLDYRGSTGYGRQYRVSLDGRWGQADTEDAAAAAAYLASEGLGDPARMVIRGRSAGGLTALGALAASDLFAAGTSHYGVTDLSALAAETHKFESGYFESLIGPWPEAEALYRARSPINQVSAITAPVLLTSGDSDRVVPLAQAQAMADALVAQGSLVELVVFAGEGHGYRRADTRARAVEVELAFYRQVLGLA
ncbi:MAG: prolyl oligopeptidase family serine peptidase [Acidimicrobiales bacterium]